MDKILNTILIATDSDELELLAINTETNLNKEKISKLKIMLKAFIENKDLCECKTVLIKQFLYFLD